MGCCNLYRLARLCLHGLVHHSMRAFAWPYSRLVVLELPIGQFSIKDSLYALDDAKFGNLGRGTY